MSWVFPSFPDFNEKSVFYPDFDSAKKWIKENYDCTKISDDDLESILCNYNHIEYQELIADAFCTCATNEFNEVLKADSDYYKFICDTVSVNLQGKSTLSVAYLVNGHCVPMDYSLLYTVLYNDLGNGVQHHTDFLVDVMAGIEKDSIFIQCLDLSKLKKSK